MDLFSRKQFQDYGRQLLDKVRSDAVIVDIETDGLENCSTIHVMVTKDITNGEVKVFTKDNWDEANLYLAKFSCVIGHNFIFFDHKYLETLGGIRIPKECVFDTLVLSQLLDAKREGGHSLEEWGVRLGFAKVKHEDWSKLSEEMILRCKGDVELTHRVLDHLMKIVNRNPGAFESAIFIEMESRWIALEMHDNGFQFNIEDAKLMHKEVTERLTQLLSLIRDSFPPKSVLIREVTPRLTKHGTLSKQGISNWYKEDDYTIFSEGSTFSLIEWEEFNPTSPKQVVERLWEAGWKPVNRTKGHEEAIKLRDKERIKKFEKTGWKVDEQNLATLPDDAPNGCQFLVEYILVDARRRTLEEWMAAYRVDSGRIHGWFNPLGTVTHRCSHTSPNMGNIATKKTIKYNTAHLRQLASSMGGRMRSMWECDPSSVLVGTDMESAHLRIFAHLINDETFTKSLIEGKKEDGTDPHSTNKRILGEVCVDRDRAKTFIFSFLNGARAKKVADIFGCTRTLANTALQRFEEGYKGLSYLNSTVIPRDAQRGYFEGIDGRLVVARQGEHGMIGMYLQNMESVLMKYANWMWRYELDRQGIRYRQVNWVHDEFVTEVSGGDDIAELVGEIQASSIKRAGELFKLNCPMSGEVKIGRNWLEVH